VDELPIASEIYGSQPVTIFLQGNGLKVVHDDSHEKLGFDSGLDATGCDGSIHGLPIALSGMNVEK
jgi:hypothetical protein